MPKYKKRQDGRYLIQIKKGMKPDGKPDYENIYARTIQELEQKAADFRSMLAKGIVIDDRGMTLETWANRWLSVYKTGKELNTYKMYSHSLKKHIIPNLGFYKLKDLRQHHVQSFINKLAADGYTKTIINARQTLKQLLDRALEDEYIVKNVASSVDMPAIRKPKKRTMTPREKHVATSADYDAKSRAFVFTLLYTGIRRGEILALTKKDIDIIQRTVTISKVIIFDKGKPILKPIPKSDAGNRIIPVPDVLLAPLSKHLSEVGGDIVFPMPTGGNLMTEGSYRRFWEKIARHMSDCLADDEVLADDMTPHLFRHTYCTDLYYAGIDLKAAQYLMGHNTIEVLLGIYTHLDRSNDDVTAERINYYFSNSSVIQSKNSLTDEFNV